MKDNTTNNKQISRTAFALNARGKKKKYGIGQKCRKKNLPDEEQYCRCEQGSIEISK